MNQTLIYFFIFFVLVVFAIILIIEFSLKKWKCSSSKECVKTLDGKYSSKEKCISNCNSESLSVMQQKELMSENEPEPVPQPTTYNCVNNSCELSDEDEGIYDNIYECEQECGIRPVIVQRPIYYGSYGIPYFRPHLRPKYYRRPRYYRRRTRSPIRSPRRRARSPRRRSRSPRRRSRSPRRRSRSPRRSSSTRMRPFSPRKSL